MDHFLLTDLRDARRSKGLSRAVLGQRVNVDPQVLKRLELGVGSLSVLVRVMAELGYHLSAVARGRDLVEQLRNRRLTLRLTLEQAAARADMSRATVAALESGEGSIRSALRLLSAIAPRARQRPSPRAHWSPDQNGSRDDQFTPPEFVEKIVEAFGKIDLDPCGHRASSVEAGRRIMLDEDGDGLLDRWSGRLAYVNPPYSSLLRWLRRAVEEWEAGSVETVVCLAPARTDSAWFHEELRPRADIFILKGRLRFFTEKGRGNQAPFPLMIVCLGAAEDEKRRIAGLVAGFWLPPPEKGLRSSIQASGMITSA